MRAQQTLLEVAEARAKRKLSEPSLLKDDCQHKPMDASTTSVLESLYARYSDEKLQGEDRASQISLGIENACAFHSILGELLQWNMSSCEKVMKRPFEGELHSFVAPE